MEALDNAIYDALANDVSVAAKVGTNIFRDTASQQTTAAVYIVYAQIGGGETQLSPVGAFDGNYLIQAVSRTSQADAEQIGDAVRNALHMKPFTVSGWSVIWTEITGHIPSFELDTQSGRKSWIAGRQVRIRLAIST